MNLAPHPTADEGLAGALAMNNASQWLSQQSSEVLDKWTTLLRQTQLPADVTCSDERVKDSSRALDKILRTPDSVLRSLAFVQFTRLVSSLREKVGSDRRRGFLC
jgi:hypothetical protein